ncbi:hypothetical protein QBC38DRAFT_30225 [Podospora fimiseda]|uniref:Uncharacterized protein n=1 Tax=Podospora fimiseda TaxID=252190 RepID=A0AAN7BVW3_9PEZI|nr:hypothetical protein QBC38DRAFT_30225 [Podospora fimiseda]
MNWRVWSGEICKKCMSEKANEAAIDRGRKPQHNPRRPRPSPISIIPSNPTTASIIQTPSTASSTTTNPILTPTTSCSTPSSAQIHTPKTPSTLLRHAQPSHKPRQPRPPPISVILPPSPNISIIQTPTTTSTTSTNPIQTPTSSTTTKTPTSPPRHPQLHTKKHHNTYTGHHLPLSTYIHPLTSSSSSLFKITLHYPKNRACTLLRTLDDFFTLQNAINHIRSQIRGVEEMERFRLSQQERALKRQKTGENEMKRLKKREKEEKEQMTKVKGDGEGQLGGREEEKGQNWCVTKVKYQYELRAVNNGGYKDGLEKGFLLGIELGLKLGEKRGKQRELAAEGGDGAGGGEQKLAQGGEAEKQENEDCGGFLYPIKYRESGRSLPEEEYSREEAQEIHKALDEFLRDVLAKMGGSSPAVEWFLRRREGDCGGC